MDYVRFKKASQYIVENILVLVLLLAPIFSLPIPKQLTVLLIVGGVISLFSFFFKLISLPLISVRYIFLIALFLMWAGITTALNGWDNDAVSTLIKSFFLFFAGLAFLVAARFLPEQKIIKFFPAILLGTSVFFAIDNSFNYPIFRAFRGFDWERVIGIAENNRGAVALVFFLWPAIAMLRGKIRSAIGLFVTVTLAVVLTGNSQSAIWGLCVGSFVFIGTYLFPRKFPLAVMIVMAAGVVASPWIAQGLFNAKPAFLMQRHEAAAPQRLYIWNAVADKVMEKPLTGWGVDATRTTAKSIVKNVGKYSKKWEEVYHPHNAALQIWLETGLIGVLIALGILWQLFLYARTTPEGFATFSTVIAVSLTGYGMWQAWWIALLFLLVVIAIMGHTNKKIL